MPTTDKGTGENPARGPKSIFVDVDEKLRVLENKLALTGEKAAPKEFVGEGGELIGLGQVTELIDSILDLGLLLNRVMDLVLETTKAERGLLILLNKETGDLEVKVARNMAKERIFNVNEISRTIVKRVIKTGEPMLTSDAQHDPQLKDQRSVVLYNLRSVLCVPFKIQDKTVGVVYVDSRSLTDLFSNRGLDFVTAFSGLAAVAIENARMHEELKNSKDAISRENLDLKQEMKRKYGFEQIIGRSQRMQEVYDLLAKVLEGRSTVLLVGESGTGKELCARAIHYNSSQSDKPFVTISCGGLPENLLESELFGHEKGAFTGAVSQKKGLFEVASGGTVFLDDIDAAPLTMQVKILRVLQEKEIRRVGGTKQMKTDVRVVVATNANLEKAVREGSFREDLYYRINGIVIEIPPLLERREDIPLLVNHFLKKYSTELGKELRGFSGEAIDCLMGYSWPGNVRELEHEVEKVVTFLSPGDVVRPEDLSEKITRADARIASLREAIDDFERKILARTLRRLNWNESETARELGVSRQGLRNKIKKYGIKDELTTS